MGVQSHSTLMISVALKSSFFLLVSSLAVSAGIFIRGANGVEVEFAAVFDAKPVGLVALLKPDGVVMTVGWDKIDLESLKAENPRIHEAYEKALATESEQPLGLGLAQDMLSLSQLDEAITQAVKDPYDWPYSSYSYETTYTDASGKTVTRTQTTTRHINHSGSYSNYAPYVLLRRIRDAKEDSQKKELLLMLKGSGYSSYGVNTMQERIKSALSKIPSAKMFPRDGRTATLISEAGLFTRKIEDLLTADTISFEHQAVIKRFFDLLKID
jgi:hypothetical protein